MCLQTQPHRCGSGTSCTESSVNVELQPYTGTLTTVSRTGASTRSGWGTIRFSSADDAATRKLAFR